MYRVIETFCTPLHRFTAGMEIAASDIDGPLSVQRWVELKKLEAVKPAKPAAPVALPKGGVTVMDDGA